MAAPLIARDCSDRFPSKIHHKIPSTHPPVGKLRSPAKSGEGAIPEQHQNSRWWQQRSPARNKTECTWTKILPKNVSIHGPNYRKTPPSQFQRIICSIPMKSAPECMVEPTPPKRKREMAGRKMAGRDQAANQDWIGLD